MARRWQRKLLPNGDPNPRYKPDTRRGDRHHSRRKSGFVAWDGEGVTTPDGVHRYVLLCSSAGVVRYNPEGLTSRECFDALLEGAAENRQSFHVAFGFNYDVNMMLRDLPRDALRILWKTGRVQWGPYDLHYKPRKEFKVKRGRVTALVWDVWGFFQGSFVKALESYGRDPALIADIKRMKEQRDIFTLDDFHEKDARGRLYCLRECSELAGMMDQFAGYLEIAGLRLTRFDGAGAVAGSLMRRFHVQEHMRRTERARLRKDTPGTTRDLLQAALHAYFGGRIELVQYGHYDGPVWQYDLRSAYPSVMQHVPCLRCGSWRKVAGDELGPDAFSVYRVRWSLRRTDTVGPFPWRDDDGAIFFPHKGRGWYWRPEVEAALEALRSGVITGRIEIECRWSYRRRCEHMPFAWIPEVYAQRQKWQEEDVGAEKVLKLGLNSLYGKTAQRIGGRKGPPTWHQIEWAGYVTSGARAAIYRAAFPAIRANALIQFATDAVFTSMPLDDLDLSKQLGAWELKEEQSMTAVMSGVYWFGTNASKMRGFEKDDRLLNPEIVRAAWRGERTQEDPCPVCSRPTKANKLHLHIRRFVTLGRALASDGQFALWRTWQDHEPKDLALSPVGTKRTIEHLRQVRPAERMELTRPADPHLFEVRISKPIELPWANARRRTGGESAEVVEERRRRDEQDRA